MKTLRTPFTTATALGLGLVFATASYGQQSSDLKNDKTPAQDHASAAGESTKATSAASASATRPGTAETNETLQIAGNDAKDRTDAKLSGREVKGSDGKELGNIKDFLVSPTAGRVEYAVISTGGVAGIGDKLRLVPMAALRPSGKKEFSVAIDKSTWDQIAPFAPDAYKADPIKLTEAEHRQLASHFNTEKAATEPSSATAQATVASLVKASDLHGKDVRSGGQAVGKIEGIVVDPERATAQALFDPKKDFAGTTQKFLIPLNQFVIPDGHEAASALFTREAFDQATGHAQVSSSSTGTLPVASTAAGTAEDRVTNVGTNTDRDAQMAATSLAQNAKTEKQTGATATRSSQQSSLASADTVADTHVSPEQKQSTAPSAGGTTTSDVGLSRTDRADTNGVNPAAVATNSTARSPANPESAAQADAQSPTSSPPNRNEQGQDIASTVPASPSSKAGSATQTENKSAKTTSSSNTSTALAANSTPSRSSTMSNEPQSGRSASSENLTPTGKTSADQSPSNDPALTSAARAVRKALDDNPSLARLEVAVTPEAGKVMLRGSVTSLQLKTAVEDTARRAAKDKLIDSELTIAGQ